MTTRVLSRLALGGLLLTACAAPTATERKTLEAEIATLKGQVEELRRNQEATAREAAMVVLDTRSVRDALSQLTRRQEETDRLLQAIKQSVESVSTQVSKLAEPRTSPAPPPPARPPSLSARVSAEALHESAAAAYRAKDFYGVVSHLTEFFAQFADHRLAESAHQLLGESYYALQEFELALGEFLKLIERAPGGARAPDALLKVGLCYRALGDAEEARNAWERLVREHPRSAEARRARSLLAEGSRPRR